LLLKRIPQQVYFYCAANRRRLALDIPNNASLNGNAKKVI